MVNDVKRPEYTQAKLFERLEAESSAEDFHNAAIGIGQSLTKRQTIPDDQSIVTLAL